MSSIDVLKLAALCVTFIVLTLLWVYRFKRDDVKWNGTTALAVSARVIFVEGAVIALVCYGCQVSVDGLLKLMPFVVIGLLISNRYAAELAAPVNSGIDGIVAAALVATFLVTCVLPFYFVKQFVIGFPDGVRFRKSLEPETPPMSPAKLLDPDVSTGTAGIVSATLRPLGQVEIEGATYDARHAGSSFVDVGVVVIVTGQQNRTLLVKEAEIINSDEKSQT